MYPWKKEEQITNTYPYFLFKILKTVTTTAKTFSHSFSCVSFDLMLVLLNNTYVYKLIMYDHHVLEQTIELDQLTHVYSGTILF